MKLKKILSFALGLSVAISIQLPVVSQYRPSKVIYLDNFTAALQQAGFIYGNYASLPYCFGSSETVNGITPIVVICPLVYRERITSYTTSNHGPVSAIWISIVVTGDSNKGSMSYAVQKAALVAMIYSNVRYNFESSLMGEILGDEFSKTLTGINVREYTSFLGDMCYTRRRKLKYVGDFETNICFQKETASTQITFLF